MDFAISETNRRRELQKDHNNKNNIIPQKIVKEVKDITARIKEHQLGEEIIEVNENYTPKQITKIIKELEKEMKNSAKSLEFEKAAIIRDQISELRKNIVSKTT